MKTTHWFGWIFVVALCLSPGVSPASAVSVVEDAGKSTSPPAPESAEVAERDPFAADLSDYEYVPPIPDPLEPVNRGFFWFNDKLYFWMLKPVASGYGWVVPVRGRAWVGNFFSNLSTPVRLVNCLLQGDVEGSGTELGRFVVNSTVGVLGFGDPARSWIGWKMRDEDFGQTLGVWGVGHGVYLCWPVIGPSSLRDTVGLAGDTMLEPLTWVPLGLPIQAGLRAYERINEVSLHIGEYEDLNAAALDPYVAFRDAYAQYRWQQVKTRRHETGTEDEDLETAAAYKTPEAGKTPSSRVKIIAVPVSDEK